MKKIIFLGDSITDASHCFLENPLGNGYVNMVAEKLNDSDGGRKKYDIMNRGHDGFTIHGVKRILEKECILKRPDVVSILIGCNDVGVMMNTGKSLEEQQFEACYEAIVKEITEQSDAKRVRTKFWTTIGLRKEPFYVFKRTKGYCTTDISSNRVCN